MRGSLVEYQIQPKSMNKLSLVMRAHLVRWLVNTYKLPTLLSVSIHTMVIHSMHTPATCVWYLNARVPFHSEYACISGQFWFDLDSIFCGSLICLWHQSYHTTYRRESICYFELLDYPIVMLKEYTHTHTHNGCCSFHFPPKRHTNCIIGSCWSACVRRVRSTAPRPAHACKASER